MPRRLETSQMAAVGSTRRGRYYRLVIARYVHHVAAKLLGWLGNFPWGQSANPVLSSLLPHHSLLLRCSSHPRTRPITFKLHHLACPPPPRPSSAADTPILFFPLPPSPRPLSGLRRAILPSAGSLLVRQLPSSPSSLLPRNCQFLSLDKKHAQSCARSLSRSALSARQFPVCTDRHITVRIVLLATFFLHSRILHRRASRAPFAPTSSNGFFDSY